MTEVLLKELNNRDIDWFLKAGRHQHLTAGTRLVQAGQSIDCLHIVIEGNLVSTVPQIDDNPLARAFVALNDNQTTGIEIANLSSGEIIGELALISMRPPATTITAVEKSQVLSIPLLQLEDKLEQEVDFAARFYRALAILLSNRLENLLARLGRHKLAPDTSIKDVLFIFGKLNDSDLDWLIANSSQHKLAPNTTLIKQGSPVDALYILLSGKVSLSLTEDLRNPLVRIFETIEDKPIAEKEIARLSKGGIVGETPFIDGRLPTTSVKALENSVVLLISRSVLSAKLQQDIGFASRFYETLAALLADRLQGILNRLVHSRRIYHQGKSLDKDTQYDDELDIDALEQMTIAGKKFDWMLEQLKADTVDELNKREFIRGFRSRI